MSDNTVIFELRLLIIKHCIAIKEVVRLWGDGNIDAAVARLEGAATEMEVASRNQQIGIESRCAVCGESSPALDWIDNQCRCPKCHDDEG